MGINGNYDAFLSLVRLGIGHSNNYIESPIDWKSIIELADLHGLTAVLVDAVEKLPLSMRPPQVLLLQWIGEVLQVYEYRYDAYMKTIAEMAGFYNSHGFKMMVLKGYACSLGWPKPKHRPSGDIDIWQFGKQEEADILLEKDKNVKVDKSEHHHTVFYWRDFMVENHYDFINVHTYKSSKELELVFKELGGDDSNFIELNGEKVYLPSPNLHALFLLRHASSHFAAEGINLRQILDWAFFVENHTKEIDWNWLVDLLEKYHMKDFYNTINAICVEDLGFAVNIFPVIQFVPEMKDKVLQDIMSPKYQHEPPSKLIPRMIFKWERWKDNEWKREMCYEERGISSLLYGLWAHLLKPSSI